MTDRTPKPLEQYQHFKGGRYQVLCLAEKEDTGETLVIYQAMYGEGKIYARSLSSFTSSVDPAKYPAAVQRYRFLRVLPPEEDETASENSGETEDAVPVSQEQVSSEEESEEEALLLDPAVEQFLDAERMEEKLDALTRARGRITDDMIDIMATSMGIEIEPGPIQERYEDLKGCLLTISRYELDRTRFRH